jgi:hypothetical protein
MTARTSVVATVAAVVVAAGCSTPVHGPGHPAATSPGPPSPADASADISEPVAVRGRVTRPDGSPVAAAQVTLVVRPEPGGAEPLTPVAEASTGSDGGYELRVPADVWPGLSADADGVIDYEVTAEAPDGTASFSWSGPPAATHPQTADLEIDDGSG